MIQTLGSWLRTLIAGAFFVSLILALAPDGKNREALRFTAGMLMTLLLILPLSKLDVGKLRMPTDTDRLRVSEIEAAANAQAEEVYSSFIRRETEEYIWSAAGELGIETLGVSLTLQTDGAYPYPWEITLRGAYSPEQKTALSLLLESELGIPPERQRWSETDAD